FADRPPDMVEGCEWLALRVQRLALTAPEAARSPDRLDAVHLVGFGDCRKAQDFPVLLSEHVADEVVLVQPLHDEDDRAVPLVVEPAVQGVDEPLVAGLPQRLGERLLRLQGIIDQDEVGTPSSQHATGGGGEPITLTGGNELLHSLAVSGKAGGKDSPIPGGQHYATA